MKNKNGKPRALVIAPQPFFSPRGTPFSVYYRTLLLSEMGIDIDFLTYGEGADVDIPNMRLIRIARFNKPIPIGPSIYKFFLDILIAVRAIVLLCSKRYSFVHAHEEAVFLCVFLKPLFRFKLVYDMHSSLPQQLSNFSFTKSRLLIGVFERLESMAIRASDAVITICPDLRDYVLKRVADKSKHFLIENSIYEPVRLKDYSSLASDKMEANEIFDAIKSGKRPVVYAGTLEHYQGIELLISAFKIAREYVPDAMLVIVGGNESQVARYREIARSNGLGESCILHPRVSQETARKIVSMADVQVSPRIAGTNTPLKIYEQLDNGIPLVATKIYSHTQILTDEVAYLADPDPASFASALVKALEDGRKDNPKVKFARGLYSEKYSRPIYEKKIKMLLERLGICAA